MKGKSNIRFGDQPAGMGAEEWLGEMRPALAHWLCRGLLSDDPKVAHAASLVAARMAGFLGQDGEIVRETAVRTIASLTTGINQHDWRSKRNAWKTCCDVVSGNGDPGGFDPYDGVLPGDLGTDTPQGAGGEH